jgi:hypothetical protein
MPVHNDLSISTLVVRSDPIVSSPNGPAELRPVGLSARADCSRVSNQRARERFYSARAQLGWAVPDARSASGIGIGRSLTASPLPHHRAYGSRTTAVRLITSALLPTGCSNSSIQHEHRSFEQLRFRQLYSHWPQGLLAASTVRAFIRLRRISMPSADFSHAIRVGCSTLSQFSSHATSRGNMGDLPG